MKPGEDTTSRPRLDDWSFLRRLALAAAVVVFLYVVWKVAPVLVLLFGALLISTLLRGAANAIERSLSISSRWSLAIVIGAIALIVAAVTIVIGSQISGQVTNIFRQIPEALDAAGARIGISDASTRLETSLNSEYGGQLFSSIAGFGYTVFGGFADFIILLIAAIYFAVDPATYRVGFAKLFPPNHRDLVNEALTAIGDALRQWFAGQLVSMVAVGSLSALVYWWFELASPIGLGIIAGLTNFVPLIGPLIGAIPALLFAFLVDPLTVLWIAGAIIIIQQIEGNLIMPLVQQTALDLPPALTLLSILLFGALFGWLGVIFAAPLAVFASVLIKKLWIRETLGRRACS